MAKDEKKGGFFSRFKKSDVAAQDEPDIKKTTPPAVQAQSRSVTTTPESRVSQLSAVQPKAVGVPNPVATPASADSVVDTVEAFNRYCSALVDIGTSQLKVVDMALSMLSNSLNKIVDGSKTNE